MKSVLNDMIAYLKCTSKKGKIKISMKISQSEYRISLNPTSNGIAKDMKHILFVIDSLMTLRMCHKINTSLLVIFEIMTSEDVSLLI